MNRQVAKIGQLSVAFMLASGVVSAAASQPFDVVVYGATAGGTMAAVAAAQEGMRVALVEPGSHVGGMVSGGLSNSDVDRQQQLIGGLARAFFSEAGEHYHQPIAYAFEPHVAEQILRGMLDKAGVRTFFGCRLAGVEKRGSQIVRIRMQNGREFSGTVFIDSGYEGDLMKAAGVSYVVGREGRDKYGESLAGRQDLLPGRHQFRFPVSADASTGGLLPWVIPQEEVAQTSEADGRFQSYCFRLCLTDQPADRLPIERPSGYNPDRYALARRYLESAKGALSLSDFLGLVRIPNGKSDINSTGPVSTDLLGASWEYPEATYERRKQIWDRAFELGARLDLFSAKRRQAFRIRFARKSGRGACRKTNSPTPAIGPINFTCAKAAACWANMS